ncbi:MAG: carboxy terminal-processing peptidase [Gammaproteobacteria bacterium]|nr:carboxy terminal-processing peptidase [Gammaproteobacteria bacterium]
MNTKKRCQALALNLVVLGTLSLVSSQAISTTGASTAKYRNFTPLYPMAQQSRVSLAILSRLSQMHYNKVPIDDALSSRMFDQYLSELDASRSYFTQKDITELSIYRLRFDESLKSGNLRPAFLVFNRYHQRVIERLNHLIRVVGSDLTKVDLTQDERLLINREKMEWPKDSKFAQRLWNRQLKNSIINLKTAGKKIDDIETLLSKRYKNQLNRALQTNSNDAFQVYVNALTKTYDPHTQYFSPRSSEDFNIHMSLSLEGIGAVLQREDEFTKVVRLVPAGPADKSKQISPADKIVGVAQGAKGELVDVVGWRLDDVVQLIRGPKESIVRLEVISGKTEGSTERKLINITRNTVKLEEQAARKDIITVVREGKERKIGLINLPTFYFDFKGAQNNQKDFKSSTRDVKRLINELKEEGIDGLVMDLRNNGGGSLQEANALTGLFIKDGPTVQIKSSNGNIDILEDEDSKIFYDGPLAVMVNRMSASASEIFAGAIQDYGRGIILGGQTFGKGTVQSLLPLHNNGQLKLTLAKFYRISGESNQNKGVIPDISFPSIYNQDEIGESALPNALVWDYIQSVDFSDWSNYSSYLAELQKSHQQRAVENPDFIYLNRQVEHYNSIRKMKTVSLSEKVRTREQSARESKLLQIENDRREAKGLKTIADLEDKKEEDINDKEKERGLLDNDDSFLLVEAGHILLDLSDKLTKKPHIAKF